MLSVYPGIFIQDKQGRISVIFPDLNHLATFGDDMEEAMAMATDCLAGYIHSEKRDGHELPPPSPVESVNPKSEDIEENDPDIDRLFVSLVSVDVDEYAKAHFNKAVKKTLSIPQWLNDAAVEKTVRCLSASLYSHPSECG